MEDAAVSNTKDVSSAADQCETGCCLHIRKTLTKKHQVTHNNNRDRGLRLRFAAASVAESEVTRQT
jgi:hypothetical protein